ncbi:MAG TPA: Uma2 family endonuclease [Thermoanaerobaculia bacterium]
MTTRTRERGATYEDLMQVPETKVAEIIDGELYAWPRPAGPHARFASALAMDIGTAYDRGRGGPGGWWIIFEPELHLRGNVIVPDLAGWRRERLPELPQNHVFLVPPDWSCEVLSPSTSRVDRAKKLPIYGSHDVQHVWLVDPLAQTVEVMQLVEQKWRLDAIFSGDDVMRAAPFDAVEIDLASIWGSPTAITQ